MPPSSNRAYCAQYAAKRKVELGLPPNTVPELTPEPACPEWAKLLITHIRNRLQSTDSKAQAAVMQINILNKQVEKLSSEVEALSSAVLQSTQLILRLLDDPDARHHAAAIVKDFQREKYNNDPNNR